MPTYVIGPDVALNLAERASAIPSQHRLVAPALLRSQVLALLFTEVRRGALARKDAERRLDFLRGLRIRLLAIGCCNGSHGKSPTNSAGTTPSWPSTLP